MEKPAENYIIRKGGKKMTFDVDEYSQEELRDELTVSQNKYMECSMCEQSISWSSDGDEERMEEHFKEKHGLEDEE